MNDSEFLDIPPEGSGEPLVEKAYQWHTWRPPEALEKALDVVPSPISGLQAYDLKKPAGKVRGIAGKFTGGRIEWNTQRDVADPGDEAQEGVDGLINDPDEDDAPVDDIYDNIESDMADGCDENGADLCKMGLHMLQANEHYLNGDHEKEHECLNKALNCYHRFHQNLKKALG